MPSTIQRTVATGSTATFAVPFGYLDPANVHATVDDLNVAFTFLSVGSIQLSSTPAAGAVVLVFRLTPSTPLVTFHSGNLDPDDLNVANLQSLMRAVEAADYGAYAEEMRGLSENKINARIGDLDARNAIADAATNSRIDGLDARVTGIGNQVISLTGSALQYRNDAEQFRNQATSSAGAASNSALAAGVSANQAQSLVTAASAAYQGYVPGSFMSEGRVTDAFQLFNTSEGRVTALAGYPNA